MSSRQNSDRRHGRPRAQPQGRHRRAATGQPRGHHRPVRVGQVVVGVRHDLRRGPAPLRRVAERVRPPVPGADGQAGRGLDRGALAGHLDRPEDHVAQPTVDGRHGHGDLRLPAPAVGADRQAALLQLRPPDRRAVGGADHRPDHGHGRGHPLHGHGADRARPQGRVRQAAAGAALRGLHAREGGRGAAPARGRDRARQEVQARHLGGRGPAGDAADLRKRLADSVETAVALADGIIEVETVPRDGEPEVHTYSRALRVPALRDLDARARAALVLVQRAARRVPEVHGPGLDDGDRPGARGAGPVADDQRGRDPAVVVGGDVVLRADRRRRSPSATRSTWTRRGRTCRRRSRTSSCTAPTARSSTSPTATGWAASGRT